MSTSVQTAACGSASSYFAWAKIGGALIAGEEGWIAPSAEEWRQLRGKPRVQSVLSIAQPVAQSKTDMGDGAIIFDNDGSDLDDLVRRY